MRLKFKIFFLLIVFLCAANAKAAMPQPKEGINVEVLREIAILEGGRKKPLDTFARETIRSITGREKFAGFDPLELLLNWLTQSKEWEHIPLIDIGYRPLQEQLHLKTSGGRIAPEDLMGNSDFQLFMQSVAAKKEEGSTLSELEKSAVRLSQNLSLFYSVASGAALTIVPQPSGAWESLDRLAERYPNLDVIHANPTLEARIVGGLQGTLSAYYQNEASLLTQLGQALKASLREQGNKFENYPSVSELQREIHFNKLKPFRIAWAGYALAFFLLLFSLWSKGKKLYGVGMGVLIFTFLVHAYGFFLRCSISGRPPVTNMYETVIWIPFGAVFFSLIFEFIYHSKYYVVVSAALASLLLILSDSVPTILDPSIDPLVPVLRSNYWLTIHVLTITLSYAAFTLALGVGNVAMGYYLLKPQEVQKINRLNYFIYRAMQVGVVLLAAGTILGGVWANASWGRFWGWDPKEVWALIALLGYLSILHGRYAGWLKGFGLAAGSIIAYLLVLMAWYGVNFILGVGLHSYGFSSGGAKAVTSFVAVELLFVGLAAFRSSSAIHRSSSAIHRSSSMVS